MIPQTSNRYSHFMSSQTAPRTDFCRAFWISLTVEPGAWSRRGSRSPRSGTSVCQSGRKWLISGCWLGRQLLWASLTALGNVDAVQLEVRSSNVAARALYGSLGFSETGSRPKYYATPDDREDAILMTLTLNHGGSVT